MRQLLKYVDRKFDKKYRILNYYVTLLFVYDHFVLESGDVSNCFCPVNTKWVCFCWCCWTHTTFWSFVDWDVFLIGQFSFYKLINGKFCQTGCVFASRHLLCHPVEASLPLVALNLIAFNLQGHVYPLGSHRHLRIVNKRWVMLTGLDWHYFCRCGDWPEDDRSARWRLARIVGLYCCF